MPVYHTLSEHLLCARLCWMQRIQSSIKDSPGHLRAHSLVGQLFLTVDSPLNGIVGDRESSHFGNTAFLQVKGEMVQKGWSHTMLLARPVENSALGL